MIAEAAAELSPGKRLVGMRDIHAKRWIKYETSDVILKIHARRSGKYRNGIEVVVYNMSDTHGNHRNDHLGGTQVASGIALFEDVRDEPPCARGFSLSQSRPCRFTARELYADQWLFHGPAFQGLIDVGRSSAAGIEGMLKILPRNDLSRRGEPRPTLLDVVSFDCFTHLLGCWGLDRLDEGDVVFPLRLGAGTLRRRSRAGVRVECRIAVKAIERHRVRVDAELVREDGGVWMRLSDWEDWRFYWPSRFRDVFRVHGQDLDRRAVGVGSRPARFKPFGSSLPQTWADRSGATCLRRLN